MTTIPVHEMRAPVTATRPVSGPTALLRLFVKQGQSLWLDHLTRADLDDGPLNLHGFRRDSRRRCPPDSPGGSPMRKRRAPSCAGVRGLAGDGRFRVPRCSTGTRQHRCRDGIGAAVAPADRPAEPAGGDPGNPQALPVIRSVVSLGANINATSIFSVARYSGVIDAYLSDSRPWPPPVEIPRPSTTFCMAEVDQEVDERLDKLADGRGSHLHGLAGIAQAKLAYRIFQERFATERCARLTRHGAQPQRLPWSSQSDDQSTGQTRYVEALNGPDTAHVLSESTAAALERHSAVEPTLDTGLRDAARALSKLGALGTLGEVGATLEARCADHARCACARVPDLPRANGEAR